jgi:sulfatase modifying factor 1
MKDFYRYLNQGTLYAIILVSVFSCMIEVPAPPKADFTHSLVTTGTATEATFTNSSVNASEFKWDFGDGVFSSEMSPKHSYNSGGNYNVKLVGKGDGGSHGVSKVVSITINEPYQPVMVAVEGGSFQMGSNGGDEREKPVHTVRVNNFSIGKYPVTSGEYRQFCAETGYGYPPTNYPDNYPVVDVSWNDAKSYCVWLSKKTGTPFRLPTEAEREFAARGGNKSQGYLYAGGNNLDEVGWFEDNSGKVLRGVGLKKANELGIYDMSGNVWDWCSDWFQSDYYAISPADNPDGPASGSLKVLRGGSFIFFAYGSRVAFRDSQKPDEGYGNVGFRVVSSK